MAKYQIVVKGVDFTGISGTPNNSQLNQGLDEIEFVDGVGGVVFSDTAPDVVTYPKLSYFLWHRTEDDLATRTGEEYWYDGAAWTPATIADGALTGAVFNNNTIDIEKLDVETGNANKIVAVNSAGTLHQHRTLASLLSAGSVPLSALASVTEDQFLIGNGSGALTAVDFPTRLATEVFLLNLFVSQFNDDVGGATSQVPYKKADATFGMAYIESLLRANQTPTSKLILPGASLFLRANASNSDIDGVSAATLSSLLGINAAVLRATASAGNDGQTVSNSTTAVVALNAETDPGNIVTFNGNNFVLIPGSYLIFASVPVDVAGGACQLQLYSIDGSNIITHVGDVLDTNGASSTRMSLAHPITVTGTADTEYAIRFSNGSGGSAILGQAANLNALGEIFSFVVIVKYA